MRKIIFKNQKVTVDDINIEPASKIFEFNFKESDRIIIIAYGTSTVDAIRFALIEHRVKKVFSIAPIIEKSNYEYLEYQMDDKNRNFNFIFLWNMKTPNIRDTTNFIRKMENKVSFYKDPTLVEYDQFETTFSDDISKIIESIFSNEVYESKELEYISDYYSKGALFRVLNREKKLLQSQLNRSYIKNTQLQNLGKIATQNWKFIEQFRNYIENDFKLYQVGEFYVLESLENNIYFEFCKLNCVKVLKRTNIFPKKARLIKMLNYEKKLYYVILMTNGNIVFTSRADSLFDFSCSKKFQIRTYKRTNFLVKMYAGKNADVDLFDNLYINGRNYGGVKRISIFNRKTKYAIISFSDKLLEELEAPHTPVYLRNVENYFTVQLAFSKNKKNKKSELKIYKRVLHKKKNLYFTFRSQIKFSYLMITIEENNKFYHKKNQLINSIASQCSKITINNNKKLFFEKNSSKANESGISFFKKVVEHDIENCYFILDKSSEYYDELYKKYGKKIVKKDTFRHYYYIYTSNYFISSELSGHVLNGRVIHKQMQRKINSTPLIFLQHGIMFAKPVEAPAAKIFYKKNQMNIAKCVINSELEAGEFYKMGYNRRDLYLSGLPKFDDTLQNNIDGTIVIMLTWRSWEEGLVKQGKALETTYFHALSKIINTINDMDIENDVLVCGHQVFENALNEIALSHPHIKYESNISYALSRASIFITDFSSASYDAHYRGAYPIYYWEDKDYLIESYGATPALDETNCDGPYCKSVGTLQKEISYAIQRNYTLDEKYENRYRNINKYSDGNNSNRLIEMMKNDKIL